MDIIGIGTPCMDNLSILDVLPRPNRGAAILETSRQGGGVTATAVVASARLGAQVGYVGVGGTCMYGQAIVADFAYNGVDTSRLVIHKGACSDFAYILSDLETEGRSILYRKGTTRSLTEADLDREYITSAKLLHLENCAEASVAAASWMREAGKKVVYDASSYSDAVQAFLPHIDIFIASEFYYNDYVANCGGDIEKHEKNCRDIADKGPEVVVFTLGDKGCVGYSNAEGYFEAPGYTVPVRDTVGAGDVFHGAFLVGLARGMSMVDCARFSNAVAAIKIGTIGGRAGIPSYETTMKFMKTGIIDRTEIDARVEYYVRCAYGI